MTSLLQAGVARAVITPPVQSTWQAGYSARKRPAEGIHDDLVATALVLDGSGDPSQRVAIVTTDVISFHDEQVRRIRRLVTEQGALAGERVLLCASHTHGGPSLYPRAGLPTNDAYIGALEQTIAGVVYAAARQLQPVALGLGRSVARFNVNRRRRAPDGQMVMRPNPDGAVERTVAVLRVDPAPGGQVAAGAAPLALLFRYTCHPTAMGAQNYLFTADYPGATRRFVERAYEAQEGTKTTAMFLPGCFANVRPHLTGPEGGFRSATWPELAALGRQLGGAVIRAGETVRDPTSSARDVDLAGPLGAALASIELPLEANAAGRQSWPAEVQVLRCGGLYLVGLPGEIFVETGWLVQRQVAEVTGVPERQVLVEGYCHGTVGYVPSAAAIPEGGYEVGAWKLGERPAGYAAATEGLLAATAADLAARLAQR
jgi:neutral ceramidase